MTPTPANNFDDRPPESREKVLWSSGEMAAPSMGRRCHRVISSRSRARIAAQRFSRSVCNPSIHALKR
jgi:hypothetical protein